MTSTSSNTTATTHNLSSSTSSPVPTKRLNRIIYEIGSILSFVGLGKDYKQHQPQSQNQTATAATIGAQPVLPASNLSDNLFYSSNSGLNTLQSTNSSSFTANKPPHIQTQQSLSVNSSTRRSQFKKQTPSTIISYSSNNNNNNNTNNSFSYDSISSHNSTNQFLNKSNLLTVSSITNSGSNKSISNLNQQQQQPLLLSPSKILSNQSHSLTRIQKPYQQHRFKSLSSQYSNDDQENNMCLNRPVSPVNPRTAASVLAAIAAVSSSATKSTIDLSSASSGANNNNNSNNNNLLSPGKAYFMNNTNRQQQEQMLKQMQKKYSKSIDTSYLSSSNSLTRSPNHSNHSSRYNLDQIDQPKQVQYQQLNSDTHSPLVPRRNDYEQTHQRFSIQRQQRVTDHSPILVKTLSNSNSLNHNNTTDSGVIVVDDYCYLNKSNNEINYIGADQPIRVNEYSKGSLNRPITLDLKPSFQSTGKHSEGISTTSTNEDDHFEMEDNININNTNNNNSNSLVSMANSNAGSYLSYLDQTNCNAGSNTASLSGGAGSFMSNSYKKQFINATNKSSLVSASATATATHLNESKQRTNNLESKNLTIMSSLSLSSSMSPSVTSLSPKTTSFNLNQQQNNTVNSLLIDSHSVAAQQLTSSQTNLNKSSSHLNLI